MKRNHPGGRHPRGILEASGRQGATGGADMDLEGKCAKIMCFTVFELATCCFARVLEG